MWFSLCVVLCCAQISLWVDKEGKTPLIAACMNPQLFNVAKTLIELGANVNAYHPGPHNGTPLHHAAKRGLEQTVRLLLSHGANALQMNDYGQTPLDLARAKGHASVVRAIEGHVCLFSGWLRELYGPGFLEHLAPQLLSRKIWVVILPIGSRKLHKPFKLELVIYSGVQEGQPRTIIPLWKANLEEPNCNRPDPVAIISNISRIRKHWRRKRAIKACQMPICKHTEFYNRCKYSLGWVSVLLPGFADSRIKLAPLRDSEKLHLQRFCNACKGIPQKQVRHPYIPFNNQVPSAPTVSIPTFEDEELARAINASLESSPHKIPPNMDMYVGSVTHPSASPANVVNSSDHTKSYASEASASHTAYRNKFGVQEADPSDNPATPKISYPVTSPTAPVAHPAGKDDGPIWYPSNDMSPVHASSPSAASTSPSSQENGEDASHSSCTICLDAPVEGACIPCGHMAGCMMCLNEIKGKNWGCPVCRTNIEQVVRIYAV
ncbi:putative E3 ubiquitin-protein ligase XBAT35 isoform X3 [Salvia splendens]|uniref:putative E3 ubiquitin-protein ligase XBAT35 isoform X3 n=1 Tax=Salvia splendens TaxID=180675 RepID=UPI001C25F6B0|nr:putative E3 ubiquitin-protein ligase XBAT35 isoform X3 [Salvia splendens]